MRKRCREQEREANEKYEWPESRMKRKGRLWDLEEERRKVEIEKWKKEQKRRMGGRKDKWGVVDSYGELFLNNPNVTSQPHSAAIRVKN